MGGRCAAPGDWFFTWQVAPTVIIGRHQDLHAEVDTDFCRREGIEVYRRKSGGGAVFADDGNVMFSLVTSRPGPVAEAFAGFTRMLADMLCSLGVEATPGGRNDIYIGDAKVSGCACYSIGDCKVAHGTMLHSVDPGRMARALTPSASKLARHGVSSVASRVTCLSRHSSISIRELRLRAVAALTDGERLLTPTEVAEVEALSRPYFEPRWIENTTRHRHSDTHSHLNHDTLPYEPAADLENHTPPQPPH